MPIEFTCDECKKLYRVKDEHAGKKIRCPNCRGAVRVPMGQGATLPVAVAEPAPPQKKLPPVRTNAAEQWYVTAEDQKEYAAQVVARQPGRGMVPRLAKNLR